MNPPEKACDLCSLSIGAEALSYATPDGRSYNFCCFGCKQVFRMLLEAPDQGKPESFQDTPLFKKCVELGIVPRPEDDSSKNRVASTDFSIKENENEFSETRKTMGEDKDLLSLRLKIVDMWCPACAWYIETVLEKTTGIESVTCNFSTDRLTLRYDPVAVSPKDISQTILQLGYKASSPGEFAGKSEKRQAFVRLVLSALLTMNIMMLSFSVYSGFFTTLSLDTVQKISWPMCLMAGIVLFYCGRPIYQKALAGLTYFSFGMETLITTGAFCAYFYSVYNAFYGSIHLYFDTAAMLVTLVLLGKMLERKAKDKIIEALENFLSLRPTKAKVFSSLYPNGRYISIENLHPGDFFGVEVEGVIPADGTIVEGNGRVDESSLTGETRSIKKKVGDSVMSGSILKHGNLKIRATAVDETSTMGQMIGIMEKAMGEKTVMEGKTEKLLQWFVPIILILALGTGIVCRLLGLSIESSIMRAITVMVISCPCALGIAIPLARVAGVSVGHKIGILVRNFSAFERAEHLSAIVFDKTGTLTRGKWKLEDVICYNGFSREEMLSVAADLEKNSDHDIAHAIREKAMHVVTPANTVSQVAVHPNGIVGTMGPREVKIGSETFLKKEMNNSKDFVFPIHSNDEELYSKVFMGIDNKICAVFLFGDRIKSGSAECVEVIQKMGYHTALISGDSPEITQKVSEIIGIQTAHGNMTPTEKVRFIRDLKEHQHGTSMVGDGINDAPAMAEADLSIGIHHKNMLGKETADITLMQENPFQIVDFIRLSTKVRKKIRQNFLFSFMYNIIAVPIAMAGLLTPVMAVCAMLLSSLSVIGNTMTMMHNNFIQTQKT